jgi:hypothetical protein
MSGTIVNRYPNITEKEFRSKSNEEKWALYCRLLQENLTLTGMFTNAQIEIQQLNQQIHTTATLYEKIDSLQRENDSLRAKIDEQKVQIDELKVEIAEQATVIAKQAVKIEEQKVQIDELKVEIAEQATVIAKQAVKIEEQKVQIIDLTNKVIALEKRDNPITVREAMTHLEKNIMFEILGSKKLVKRYGTIRDVLKETNPTIVSYIANYFTDNHIDEDHMYHLLDLKENGNLSAHEYRPSLKRNEWNQFINSTLGDPTEEEINMNNNLLNLLEKYSPVTSADSTWIIQKFS